LDPLPPYLKEGNCVFKRRKGGGGERYKERKDEKEEV
jgi:hypothetical protein